MLKVPPEAARPSSSARASQSNAAGYRRPAPQACGRRRRARTIGRRARRCSTPEPPRRRRLVRRRSRTRCRRHRRQGSHWCAGARRRSTRCRPWRRARRASPTGASSPADRAPPARGGCAAWRPHPELAEQPTDRTFARGAGVAVSSSGATSSGCPRVGEVTISLATGARAPAAARMAARPLFGGGPRTSQSLPRPPGERHALPFFTASITAWISAIAAWERRGRLRHRRGRAARRAGRVVRDAVFAEGSALDPARDAAARDAACRPSSNRPWYSGLRAPLIEMAMKMCWFRPSPLTPATVCSPHRGSSAVSHLGRNRPVARAPKLRRCRAGLLAEALVEG